MSKFMNFGSKKSLDFLNNIRENVVPIMRNDKETVFTLGLTTIDNKHLCIALMPEKIHSNSEQFDNLKDRFNGKIEKCPLSLKSIDYLQVDSNDNKKIIEAHKLFRFMDLLQDN